MSKLKLYDHQERGLERTKGRNKLLYAWDMGTGKTFVGAEKMVRMGTAYNIVVCQKSKVDDWVQHFKEFYPWIEVIDYTKRNPKIRPGVIVINYDLIWRREELKDLRDITLVLDESSCIKNPKSNRTRAITGCSRPKVESLHFSNLIMLSGTPGGGKYEDLLTQINLLGWDISKREFFYQFVKYYEIERMQGFRKFTIPVVTGYKNIGILKRKLREYGVDFLKTREVLDLPKQVRQIIKVKSTPEYRKFEKTNYVAVEGVEFIGDYGLKQNLGKRMLASCYNPNKWAALIDLMESTSNRLVIFYNFKAEFEKLKEVCKKLKKPFGYVNGEGRIMDPYQNKEDGVLLVQYQSGAMGLNLQAGNRMVFFSLTRWCELYEQAFKRIHRMGQSETCFYYFLMAEGTVDYEIKESLDMGVNYNQKLYNRDRSGVGGMKSLLIEEREV